MTENQAIKIIKQEKQWESNARICDAFETSIKALEEIQQYRSIGTVEEFKALKEKSVAKKPLNDGMRIPFSYYCPNCKEELSDDGYEPDEEYCCNCGQHILIKN